MLISSDAKSLEEAAGKLAAFAGQTDYKMTSEMDNGKLSIKSYGVSAHGSTPEKGQNAIAQMLEFLNGISLEGEGVREYIGVLAQKIGFETDGKSMGVDLEDEISGKLVFNLGQIDLEQNHGRLL